MVGQLGRPSPWFVEKLVAAEPYVQAGLTGAGECDFYGPRRSARGFDTLTSIIEDYEPEQARVCATVPNCSTDDALAPRTWNASSISPAIGTT